jgi:O-antigen/teichoic acid export membrane protein
VNQITRPPSDSLRTLVFRGGIYLGVRQVLGLAIGLLGPIYLLREIGPGNYGLYAAALSILTYIQLVSQWGVEIYLMRHPPSEDCAEVYHQGFTILIVLAALGIGASFAILPLLDGWMKFKGFYPVASLMFLTLPLLTLRQVPLAKLERELNYKRIALIELSGQACFYIVSLPLAFRERNVWAAVAGWWCQQGLLFALFFIITRYRPSLHFDLQLTKRILGYGLGYSTSIWVWQLRNLVNPLIVGQFAGSAAVGFVALAIRIVEVLSFARSAAWRVSIAALARLQGERGKLLRAIREGMRLQILAVGPPLVIFSWIGGVVVSRIFGWEWGPVMVVYPFVALSYLANSLFNLHSSALYVMEENWDVTFFHVGHVGLFVGSAVLLVPHFGIVGYGLGEIAALAAYFIIDHFVRGRIGSIDYRLAGIWAASLGLALFEGMLGKFALCGLAAVTLWPATWRQMSAYCRDARRAIRNA